jgi:hypothetical protein
MIRGEFSHDVSPRFYTSTTFIHTFRPSLFNYHSQSARNAATELIMAFMFSACGWADFGKDDIYSKANVRLSSITEETSNAYVHNSGSKYKSSHYARIAKRSNTDMLKYHHYIYDSLMCLFVTKKYGFLECMYDVLITYSMGERYYQHRKRHRVYFDCDFLIYGLCEAFSLYDLPDCVSSNVFGKNISNMGKELEDIVHICTIETIPYMLLRSMFNLMVGIGVDSERILRCGLFDEVLQSLFSNAFFKEQRRQKSAVLGIASLVQLFQNDKQWIHGNLFAMVSALLFYMKQDCPEYKNLVLHTLIHLVTDPSYTSVQESNTTQTGRTQKRDVVGQLFECLSSKYQDLRNVALCVLKHYARSRSTELKAVLEPYTHLFYERVSTKTIGHNLYGFLDCLLFLSSLFPDLEINPQFLSFLNVSLASNFSTSLTPESALLKIKGQFYLLRIRETEDSVNTALEYVYKYLVDPIYDDDAFISYCRGSVLKISNTKMVFSFSNRIARAAFGSLHSEKTNIVSNLNVCVAIVRIFPIDFTNEMVGVCINLLPDSSNEVFIKVMRILTYVPRVLEAERIIQFFKTFAGDVGRPIVAFFETHNYLLEPLLAYIDNGNIFEIVKQLLGTKHIFNFYKSQMHKIRVLLSRDSGWSFVSLSLLLSRLGYRFDDNEIHNFIAKYDSLYHTEFVEFLNMNAALLTNEHMDKIYAVVPHIVLNNQALADIRSHGHLDAAKSRMVLGEVNQHDTVFESKIDDPALMDVMSVDPSFSEMAYLFSQTPTPELFSKIVSYNEFPARILEVLRRPAFDPEVLESAVLDALGPEVSYKIHLMVIIPLLIERPCLITHRVLPCIIEAIHRLFGTVNPKHKLVGGRLLLAAYSIIGNHPSYAVLITHLFNFCIAAPDPDLLAVYKKFDLDVGDACLDGAQPQALCECLAHEMKMHKSVHLYHRALDVLSTHISDTCFDPLFTKYLFLYNPELCAERLKSTVQNPNVAYHLLLYAFESKNDVQGLVLGTLANLLEAYENSADTGSSAIDFRTIVEMYSFEKNYHYLTFLGKLASYVDDSYVFEEIIAVMDTVDVESMDFIDLSLSSEGFFNFIIYIFRNDKYSRYYDELQGCFVRGLQSYTTYVREELHELLSESVSMDWIERMKYLLGFNWNSFERNWTYTFLRMLINEELVIKTLKLYTTGDDTFYEDVYVCVTRNNDSKEEESKKFEHIETFKQKSHQYAPASIRRAVLDVCFYNEDACLKHLCAHLRSFVTKNSEWVGQLENDFRGFALELNATPSNSTTIGALLEVFGYFLLDVRIRHNALFAGITTLKLSERSQVYKHVEESNFYYGSFTTMFHETDEAAKEILLGNHDKAQHLLLKANEHFTKENFNKHESEFIRDEWKKAAKMLSQWDALYEVSSATNDHDTEAESYFMSRGAGPEFGLVVSRMSKCFERFVFECISDPKGKDLDSVFYLGQRELARTSVYTSRFTRILARMQTVVELGERMKSRALACWVRREPCYGSSLVEWSYYCSFREYLFNVEDSDLHHELARALNKATEIAIDTNNFETARHLNAKVFAIKNIRPADAFDKICNELKIHLKQGDYEQGLRKARMVNMGYFSDEQKSTIFGYIAQFSESDSNYKNSIHICPSNAENWYNWGRYFEKKDGNDPRVIENIFIAFINAAVHTKKKNAFKMFIKCMKYFKHESEVDIARHLRDSINSIDYQAFSPFSSFFIESLVGTGSPCAEICLYKLGQHIPQTVFRLIKIEIERLVSLAAQGERNDAVIRKLHEILNKSRFETSREQLGLTMIMSICKKKIVFTLEETVYALLDSIFSIAALQIENKISTSDLKKTVQRVVEVTKTSSWNASVYSDFRQDFCCESMNIVELALKTYKWMDVIENILKTYATNRYIDLSISSLVNGLSDFRILMFGYHEHMHRSSKIYIDHFRPSTTFYISNQLLTRSLTIVGSDGRDYVYAVRMAGSGYGTAEKKIRILADLISSELKERHDFFHANFNFKSVLNFTPDVNLVEVTEPVSMFCDMFGNHLFASSRAPKRILFEYLKIVEDITGEKMYPGLERQAEFLRPQTIGTEHALDATTTLAPRSAETTTLVIVDNNVHPTKATRLKAFKKMATTISKDILCTGFSEVYGNSHTYFLFKKKSILSYTLVSTFCYAFFINQHRPCHVGVGLFSSNIVLRSILPFTQGNSDYFRLTQNIQHLYKEEGLDGVFVPFSHKLAVFLREEEFVREFVETFFTRNYADVVKRLEGVMDGKVREIMNMSTDPESMCMRDILWHPWF